MTRRRKQVFPKIRLKVWGSSHTTNYRGVPSLLDALLLQIARYQAAENNSDGGRIMCKAFVDAILYDIDASVARDEPFVIIICLGTNNIRKEGQAGDILPFFEEIVNYIANLQRIHIFICGMLPSPKHDSTTSGINFSQASSLLQNLCAENSMKTTFINLGEVFTNNGIIKTEYFCRDEIHLTQCLCEDKSLCECTNLGAELFAQTLFNALQKLPKKKIEYN